MVREHFSKRARRSAPSMECLGFFAQLLGVTYIRDLVMLRNLE